MYRETNTTMEGNLIMTKEVVQRPVSWLRYLERMIVISVHTKPSLIALTSPDNSRV